MRKKPPFPPTSIVEAVESFAWQGDGPAAVYIAGTRLRGDHPAVVANPHLWIAAGAPHDEIQAQLRDNHATDPQPAPPVVRTVIESRVRDEDAVVSKQGPAGVRLAKTDPRVKANPDAFVDVVPKGLKREDAYIALGTLMHTRGDDSAVTIYQGCWYPKDGELVALHPLQFGLITPEA